MTKCTNCHKDKDLYSGIRNGKTFKDVCESCANIVTATAIYARKFERDWQQREYAKDILQRWRGVEPSGEFIRAYREESEQQWGPDVLRKYQSKD